jgi:ATP-dependent RNA helicase DDX10/DBP4
MHVLRTIGRYHRFSIGLLMGGQKDFYTEQERIRSTNILLATPGRLLQHLEQTPDFDTSQVKLLVLDEADRILDMGFATQLERILEYLPIERQTLLFSATQTKDVKRLATLSLQQPEYIGVHDQDKSITPEALQQSYIVVPLEHKLNALYSFLKTHLKAKSIVFFSTCAQARHAWELLCALRPGIPVLALHGKLMQTKRLQIYTEFCRHPHAVLLATDVAARGLDIPHIDWVVQVDAPEDRDMYIHRVGRTARYRAGGKALMMVTPAEYKAGFIDLIQGSSNNQKNLIPLKRLAINPSKTMLVTPKAAALAAANDKLHQLAKKAFCSYVRSIHLMPPHTKHFFQVSDLPLDAWAVSLGLSTTPTLQFLKTAARDRTELREQKNVNRKLQKLKEQIQAEKLAKKVQAQLKQGGTNSNVQPKKTMGSSSDDDSSSSSSSDDESMDGLLISRGEPALNDHELPQVDVDKVSQSRHQKKIRIDASLGVNQHVKFTDDGAMETATDIMKLGTEQIKTLIHQDQETLHEATQSYMEQVRERLRSNFEQDRVEHRERVREKHRKRRLQEKGPKESNDADEPVVLLGTSDDDDDDNSTASSSSSSSTSEHSNANQQQSGSPSSSDSSSDSEDEEIDVAAQEELALSLIRGNA